MMETKMKDKSLLIILFFTLVFISLVTLGGYRLRLWGDETETALFGKMVAEKGLPLEWDGTNFLGYEADSANINGQVVNHTNPWLMYYLTAFSFRLFGVTDFSTRIPAIFFSIFIIPITYLLVRKITGNLNTGLYTAVALSLSVQLILFSYQARYYSLLILLGLLLTYFAHDISEHGVRPKILFLIVAIVSFYNHYVIFPIFYFCTLAGYLGYFVAQKKGFRKIVRFTAVFLLLGSLSFAAFFPYFWLLHPLSTAFAAYTFTSLSAFLSDWKNFVVSAYGFFNTANVLPVLVLLLLPLFIVIKKTRQIFPSLVFFAVIPAVFLFFTSFHSALFMTSNPLASMRYASLLIPFYTATGILLLEPIALFNQKIFLVIFSVFALTNLLTLNKPRILLIEYIREMISPYETAEHGAAKFLSTYAQKSDTAFVSLERAHEPLIFLLGEKIRFINRISPLNSTIFTHKYNLFPKYIYNYNGKPDWIILFSKKGVNHFDMFDYRDYRELPDINLKEDYSENILPVFYTDTTRPEIYMHEFREYKPNDRDKIYIYGKKK